MNLIVVLILILLLLFNTYQDFRSRSVYWINIPVIIVVYGMYVFLFDSYFPEPTEIVVNALILCAQIGFVMLFSYLQKRDLQIINKKIGIADILFLAMLIFVFSPINLILFELILFTISLVCSVVINMLKRDGSVSTIPLAGNLTLGMALLFMLEYSIDLEIRSRDVLEQTFMNLMF